VSDVLDDLIGSVITDVKDTLNAADKLLTQVEKLKRHKRLLTITEEEIKRGGLPREILDRLNRRLHGVGAL
jgi:hypothetical protein